MSLSSAIFFFLMNFFFVFLWVSMGLVSSGNDCCSPFECGFESKHFGRSSFSVRFFLFVSVFLIFDVEVVMFFHLPSFEENGSFLVALASGVVVIYLSFILEEEKLMWGW